MSNFLIPPGTPGGFGGPPVPSFHKAADPFGLFGGGGPARAHNVTPNTPHTGGMMQNQGFATPFFANQQPGPAPAPAMGGAPMGRQGLPMTMFGNPQQGSGVTPNGVNQLNALTGGAFGNQQSNMINNMQLAAANSGQSQLSNLFNSSQPQGAAQPFPMFGGAPQGMQQANAAMQQFNPQPSPQPMPTAGNGPGLGMLGNALMQRMR